MRTFDDGERRARLGRRHALAPSARVDDPVAAARAVVGLHGTDPASTFLSAVLRMREPDLGAVERALYDERSLVRVLAMRRTLFAVPRDLVTACHGGAGDLVAREQRRLMHKLLVDSEVTDDPEPWLAAATEAAVAAFAGADGLTAPELAAADDRLGARISTGGGANAAWVSVASRVLTLLSAEGVVVRTRPRGGWTSTQFRWALHTAWADVGAPLPSEEAAASLARAWLRAFGPALPADLQWWGRWTVARTKAALRDVGAVEVDLGGVPGVALPDDLETGPEPEPWVALLPALDPTTMGWKERGFYLGEHRARLFDVNGNAGPTVWCDGRVVGGWAHRADGEVAVRLLEDVGRERAAEIQAQAERVRALVGDVRLSTRARGPSPVEKELRA